MKTKLKVILLMGCLASPFSAFTQDYLFSQYFNSPHSLNPGLVGDMPEDFRAYFLHRRQWYTAAVPFNTTVAGADMNFYKIPFYLDRVGGGFTVLSEDMGTDFFKNQQALLSLSVGKKLDKKQKTILGFGVQGGIQNKSLNPDNLAYESQYTDYGEFDKSRSSGESFSDSWNSLTPQINIGATYTHFIRKGLSYFISYSAGNILGPKDKILLDAPSILSRRPFRHLGNVSFSFATTERLTLIPTLLFSFQKGAMEPNLGVIGAYRINRLNVSGKTELRLGAFHRWKDSFIVLRGIRIQNAQVDVSYDVGISGLNKAARLNDQPFAGSVEVSLTYRGFINRLLPDRQSIPCHFF